MFIRSVSTSAPMSRARISAWVLASRSRRSRLKSSTGSARVLAWPITRRSRLAMSSLLDVKGARVVRVGEGGPRQRERRNRVLSAAVDGQLAQYLAQQRSELVGVAGAATNEYPRVLRQRVDDEVAVGRHVVQAGLGVELGAEEPGDVLAQPVLGRALADRVRLERARGSRDQRAGRVNAHLGGHLAIDRKAVDGLRPVPDEDREAVFRKIAQVGRGVVSDLLLGDAQAQRPAQRQQQLIRPGAGGDDEPAGAKRALRRVHLHPIVSGADGMHRATLEEGGAVVAG